MWNNFSRGPCKTYNNWTCIYMHIMLLWWEKNRHVKVSCRSSMTKYDKYGNRGEYKLKLSRNTSSTLILKIEAWQRARNHIDYKTELSPNQLLCLKRTLKFILRVVKFWSRLFCHMLGNEILNKNWVSQTKPTTQNDIICKALEHFF